LKQKTFTLQVVTMIYSPHMAAKEITLDELGEMIERGFGAIASDIADIKSTMATKEDIADMVTKGDVRTIVSEELSPIHAELRSTRGDLEDLMDKFENVSGFRKEIDHALERIAAIEKHLGIDKKKMVA
jgi:predicted  nucleic acid-binding Zn-ribbon protein